VACLPLIITWYWLTNPAADA